MSKTITINVDEALKTVVIVVVRLFAATLAAYGAIGVLANIKRAIRVRRARRRHNKSYTPA